jgi:hypothetical protein
MQRARGILALAALSVAAASCSGSSSAPRATTTTVASGTSTTAPSGTSPGTTRPPPASSQISAPGAAASQAGNRCTTGQLRISAGPLRAAAGHEGVVLSFVNTGAPCSMQGYPGVAGLDSSGRQLTQAARTTSGYLGGLGSGAAPALVSIAEGQAASSLIESTDVPSGSSPCQTYSSLLVTPPDETRSVTVQAQMTGCSGLQVHPVVRGVSGSS